MKQNDHKKKRSALYKKSHADAAKVGDARAQQRRDQRNERIEARKSEADRKAEAKAAQSKSAAVLEPG